MRANYYDAKASGVGSDSGTGSFDKTDGVAHFLADFLHLRRGIRRVVHAVATHGFEPTLEELEVPVHALLPLPEMQNVGDVIGIILFEPYELERDGPRPANADELQAIPFEHSVYLDVVWLGVGCLN